MIVQIQIFLSIIYIYYYDPSMIASSDSIHASIDDPECANIRGQQSNSLASYSRDNSRCVVATKNVILHKSILLNERLKSDQFTQGFHQPQPYLCTILLPDEGLLFHMKVDFHRIGGQKSLRPRLIKTPTFNRSFNQLVKSAKNHRKVTARKWFRKFIQTNRYR